MEYHKFRKEIFFLLKMRLPLRTEISSIFEIGFRISEGSITGPIQGIANCLEFLAFGFSGSEVKLASCTTERTPLLLATRTVRRRIPTLV